MPAAQALKRSPEARLTRGGRSKLSRTAPSSPNSAPSSPTSEDGQEWQRNRFFAPALQHGSAKNLRQRSRSYSNDAREG